MATTHKYSGQEERDSLIGLIAYDGIAEAFARLNSPEPFSSAYANLVARWCIQHYRKHRAAPGRKIEDYFSRWAERATSKGDADQAVLVERLLAALSQHFEQSDRDDPGYYAGIAERHIQWVAAKRRAEIVQAAAENGRDPKHLEELERFRLPRLVPRERLILASSLQAAPTLWLWEPWIPFGELTVIDGDPGTGKSQISLDIAARLSQGWEMPPAPRKRSGARGRPARGSAVILSSEDGQSKVILPRLQALRADLDRCLIAGSEAEYPIHFPADYPWLRSTIENLRTAGEVLVVIDPFYGFLATEANTSVDHKMRSLLRPLAAIAQETGAAIVLIRHLNKRSDEDPLYRGGGSIALTAHCRSAILLGRDPANPETRIMAMNRSTLGPKPPSLAYQIETVEVETGNTSRIHWVGESGLMAGDIVGRQTRPRGRPSQIEECAEFIRRELAGREMPSKELEKLVCEEFGIGERTYKKVRQAAGVLTRRDGFQGGMIAYLDGCKGGK